MNRVCEYCGKVYQIEYNPYRCKECEGLPNIQKIEILMDCDWSNYYIFEVIYAYKKSKSKVGKRFVKVQLNRRF